MVLINDFLVAGFFTINDYYFDDDNDDDDGSNDLLSLFLTIFVSALMAGVFLLIPNGSLQVASLSALELEMYIL